jgi:hypothetical protein
MARREYATTFRPFRNSPQTVRIVWRRATPGAMPLPFPSKICSLDWVTRPALVEGPGEVYGAPRTFLKRGPFGGPALDHICGTEEEHRQGELLDDMRPLAEYGASGLPKCCDPDREDIAVPLAFTPVMLRDVLFDKVTVVGLDVDCEAQDESEFDHTNAVGLRVEPVGVATTRTEFVTVVPLTARPEAPADVTFNRESIIPLTVTPVTDRLQLFDHSNAVGLRVSPVTDLAQLFDHSNAVGLRVSPVTDRLQLFDHSNAVGLRVSPVTDRLQLFDHSNAVGLRVSPVTDRLQLFDHSNAVGLRVSPVTDRLQLFDHSNAVGLRVSPVTTHTYVPPPPPPPPPLAPGTACSTAGTIPMGTTYSGPVPASFASDWFTFVPTATGSYHVVSTGITMGGVSLTVLNGGSCPAPSPASLTTFGPPRFVWNATAGVRCWIRIDNFSGSGTYSIIVDTGP